MLLLYAYFAWLFQKDKIVLKLGVFLLGTFFCYMFYYNISVMPNLHPHQGDGQFINISEQLGLLAIPGYCIKMPQFDLSRRKQAEYRLSKLPTPPRHCRVYFAINANDNTWQTELRKNMRAILQLELWDSSGQILVNLYGNLADYTAYSSNRMNFIALYPWKQNILFFPEIQKNYVVRIKYEPDIKLKGYQGFVYFECGGSK